MYGKGRAHMRYECTLLAVSDLERSRRFYQEVLGMQVTSDFGANVTLDGRLSLQTLETWKEFLHSDAVVFGHQAGELYFEEEDMDAFSERLRACSVPLVHPLREHRWGQRVVRFYDPDRHVIEVGESMKSVVRRFLASGLTESETAARMDVPLSYVRSFCEG